MCDAGTLTKIRKIWESFNTTRMNKQQTKKYEEKLKTTMQKAKDLQKNRVGETMILIGFRSAAPVGLQALEDLPRLYQAFWNTGTTDAGNKAHPDNLHQNPMFVSCAENASSLHYGTDPLLGFHLATAYAPLTLESPLKINQNDLARLQKVVEAAKIQFKAWSRSFLTRVPGNMILRFFAGDALSFCHTLQHLGNTDRKSRANLYRDSFHSEPLELSENDYGVTGDAPIMFNVIDTSNIIDHLGALNVLVASSPLLSEELAATLFIETLVKREKSLKAMLDELLCGHFPTISLLLGLFPVEYWTNATAISTVDEALFDFVHRATAGSKYDAAQMYCRFAWKRSPTRQAHSANQKVSRMSVNPFDLASILSRVYLNMFQNENMGLLLSEINLQRLQNNSTPQYHRGSIAGFIALLKGRLLTDWNSAMKRFLDLVETDKSIMMSLNYIQELYLYLHMFGVFSASFMEPSFYSEQKYLDIGGSKGSNQPSSVLCITIKVPRAVLKPFKEIPRALLGTPPLQIIFESSNKTWQNIFSVVQLAFGETVMSDAEQIDKSGLLIHTNGEGWMGTSSLSVSCYVPSWVVLMEPRTATVALGIKSTPQSSATFVRHFGLDLKIFRTTLGNKQNIHLARYAPN